MRSHSSQLTLLILSTEWLGFLHWALIPDPRTSQKENFYTTDAEIEKSDFADEDTNVLDNLRLSKKKPRRCLDMMKAGKSSTGFKATW